MKSKTPPLTAALKLELKHIKCTCSSSYSTCTCKYGGSTWCPSMNTLPSLFSANDGRETRKKSAMSEPVITYISTRRLPSCLLGYNWYRHRLSYFSDEVTMTWLLRALRLIPTQQKSHMTIIYTHKNTFLNLP